MTETDQDQQSNPGEETEKKIDIRNLTPEQKKELRMHVFAFWLGLIAFLICALPLNYYFHLTDITAYLYGVMVGGCVYFLSVVILKVMQLKKEGKI